MEQYKDKAILKIGKVSEEAFFQKKKDSQMANKYRKDVQHHYSLEKSNQNRNGCHFIPTRMAVIEIQAMASVGKNVTKLEPSLFAG